MSHYRFSIDALSAAGDKAWRLLDDRQHWRTSSFTENLHDTDARLQAQDEVSEWVGRKLIKDADLGLKPASRPGIFDILMRGIFAHAIVHRLSPAAIPDKGSLADTVKRSEPGQPWLIYLDLSGHFRALDTSEKSILANTQIAVRGEIASSPDYIGAKAACNEVLINDLYRQFLEGWYNHLQSRRIGLFVPDREKVADEQVTRQKILGWQHE